eukprot:6887168-Prymnesium_polylepis.1
MVSDELLEDVDHSNEGEKGDWPSGAEQHAAAKRLRARARNDEVNAKFCGQLDEVNPPGDGCKAWKLCGSTSNQIRADAIYRVRLCECAVPPGVVLQTSRNDHVEDAWHRGDTLIQSNLPQCARRMQAQASAPCAKKYMDMA